MKEQIPLLNFLRSNRFILYVTIFTVIWLAPNTYYVSYEISSFITPYREGFSGGAALLVAASIMIYTLRKNYDVALYYALFEMSISAYYYTTTLGLTWALIPAYSFTLMLPISLKGYAREIEIPEEEELQEHLPDIINVTVTAPGKEPEQFTVPPKGETEEIPAMPEINKMMDENPKFSPPAAWLRKAESKTSGESI